METKTFMYSGVGVILLNFAALASLYIFSGFPYGPSSLPDGVREVGAVIRPISTLIIMPHGLLKPVAPITTPLIIYAESWITNWIIKMIFSVRRKQQEDDETTGSSNDEK